MRTTEAINIIESVLRDLIREVIGEAWQTHPKIDMQKLVQQQSEDKNRRPGTIGTPPLIEYLEFWHLSAIINDNWAEFKPALEAQKRFTLDMDRLANFRNPTMHSRELLEHEEHLVLGITGQLRVQITKYRSEKGKDEMYYPNIVHVEDATHGQILNDGLKSAATLRPGDKLTYRCSATDPQGRPLQWKLRVSKSDHSLPVVDEAEGDDVELSWTVSDDNVMDNVTARIELSSNGLYHREGVLDDSSHICYTVHPPLT